MSFTVSSKALIVIIILVISSLGGGAIGGYLYGQLSTKIEYQNTITTLTQEKDAASTRVNELNIINNVLSANNTVLRQTIMQQIQQNNLLQQNNQALTTQNNALTAENQQLKQQASNANLQGLTTLKIGYIASSTTTLETAKPYLEQIITPDLNNYLKGLGYNFNVQFLIDDAQGQPNTHLEKIQGFHSMDVNLVIGGGWSSQAQGSLSYVNSNNMLLVSTSSTSPTLAIAGDRLFRMCSNDAAIAPALANVMWAAGVKTVIIFQRGDSWGDGIVNLFVPIWQNMGGRIGGEKIRYAAEATEFANYLDIANQQVMAAVASYGGEKQRVGVLLLSFDEAPVIAKQASQYPGIYNVHWWGSDGTAKSIRLMTDSPEEANHLGIYSLLSRETLTPLYSQLEAEYTALTHQQFSTYSAYVYDAAFAIVKAVLMTGSTDAAKVSAAFPTVCNSMYGASGLCKLDATGDRAAPPYDVWGFFPGSTAGSVQPSAASTSIIMAQYDPEFQMTTFVTSVLGYTPIGP